jgi:hypothetical protein
VKQSFSGYGCAYLESDFTSRRVGLQSSRKCASSSYRLWCAGVLGELLFRACSLRGNPYLFSDMTWGFMYVLQGLAGVGLIALIMISFYFVIRPAKLDITKSMIFGSMSRDFYLKEHDSLDRRDFVFIDIFQGSESRGLKNAYRN